MPRTRDWRSPEAADVLKDLDRSRVAWEFLRRDPEYCEHYASVVQRIDSGAISHETGLTELSDRWGCMFIRDPSLTADADPLLWHPELLPLSATLVAAPDGYPEAHRPASRCRRRSRKIAAHGWPSPPDRGRRRRSSLVAFRRLGKRQAGGNGRPRRSLRPSDRGAHSFSTAPRGTPLRPIAEGLEHHPRHLRRLALMLRALDGHLARASYREIANALFGSEAVARYAWKTSSIRGQTIRLVKDDVRTMKGGYRRLLRGD